jgi:hypothetical protein
MTVLLDRVEVASNTRRPDILAIGRENRRSGTSDNISLATANIREVLSVDLSVIIIPPGSTVR